MKSIFLIPCLTFVFLSFSNCSSTQNLKNEEQLEGRLRERILFYVKSMNEGDKAGLEKSYANDYEGIFPVTKFENKNDLVNQLIKNQKELKLKIEIKILEISAKSEMGYAILDWKAISNFGESTQNELYNKKHLQIWVKNGKEWLLKRSLFYN